MVMNKILFFTLSLVMAITAYGQNSASVDTLQTASDSTSVGSHAEFSAARQESNVTKAEGDSAYIRNDYASAIQIYENLLKKGEAAEVYYNLGNSYYKADDIARAILNYERALLLEPGNADIRANLEIARSKTIDKVIPVPEVFFVSWTKSLINCLSVDAWAVYFLFGDRCVKANSLDPEVFFIVAFYKVYRPVLRIDRGKLQSKRHIARSRHVYLLVQFETLRSDDRVFLPALHPV